MKKTLVALAVAAVAASASATTVYNNEGTKVDIGGRVDVMIGKFNKNERTDLRNNESRIDVHAEHQLDNGLKAIAHYRMRFNEGGDKWATNNGFNNPQTNKLWLGLEHADVGRVTFGKQDTNQDSVQMNDHAYAFGGNNNLNGGGNKVASFRTTDFQIAEGQTLGFGVDYLFGQSNKKGITEDKFKYGYGASVFYAGQFGDFGANVNAGFSIDKFDRGSKVTDTQTGNQNKAWRVATQFTYGPVVFGAEYGQTAFKAGDENTAKARYIEVGAKYQYLENASIYAQWERNQVKAVGNGNDLYQDVDLLFLANADKYQHAKELHLAKDGKITENVFIVGTDYAFSKNVVVYAEYARSAVKATGTGTTVEADGVKTYTKYNDNKYGVGVRVYF